MRLFSIAVLLLTASACPAWALAENEGQAELDQAIEAKVTADSFEKITQVIDLCQTALEKGLDEENTTFAKQLLASTLVMRGTALGEAVFQSVPTDANQLRQWSRLRTMALADLERAVENEPQQPDALLLIGRLNVLPGGDREKGIKALTKAIDQAGDDVETKSRAYVIRAELQEDPQQRIADYNAAVDASPSDAEVLRARASVLLESGKSQEALADLDASLAIEPDNAGAHEARGIALSSLTKYDEALAALEKSLDLEDRNPFAYVHRARVYALTDKPKDAINDLDKSLLLAPENVQALLLRATMYQQIEKLDKALADADRAIELQPDNSGAQRIRAMLLADADKLDEAIDELEELKNDQGPDAGLLLQLALLYEAKPDKPKAIEAYTGVLEIESENTEALRGRGDAYLTTGKHAEALADFEASLKLTPDDSGLLNNLAWLLATSPEDSVRNGSRAIELATKACELTEYKQAHILSTLASGYAETGDFAKAIEWSTKAVESAEEGELKVNLEKELESYRQDKPWRERLTGEEPVVEE